MARHRHAVNVRADGLTAVLGPLADDAAVRAALLIDIDSGMVLGATGHPTAADREMLGAVHGELMRLACGAMLGADGSDRTDPGALDTEVTVHRGPRQHVVVRRIADTYGDRLALSLLVEGPPWALRRVRRRLGRVSTAALTAGPTVSLRPRDGAWVPGPVEERPALRTAPRPPVAPAPEAPDPTARVPALAVLDDGGGVPRSSTARGAVHGLGDQEGPAAPVSGDTTVPALPAVVSRPAPAVPPAGSLPDAPDRRPAPPSALPPPGPPRP